MDDNDNDNEKTTELEVCEQALYLLKQFLIERHADLLPDLAAYIDYVVRFDIDLYDDASRYKYAIKCLEDVPALSDDLKTMMLLDARQNLNK